MGWTRSGAHFIRGFAAVLLFAGSQNLGKDGGDVGSAFLLLCAARHHGQPMFHAGYSVARSFHHRALFLSTLRSEEHTSELQSHLNLVCRLLLEKKKNITNVWLV